MEANWFVSRWHLNFFFRYAKKEFITTVISLVLLAGFVVVAAIRYGGNSLAEDTLIDNGNAAASQFDLYNFDDKYYYNQLEPRIQEQFGRVYCAVKNMETEVAIDNLTVNEMERIIYLLHFDCPELFYISSDSQYYNYRDGVVVTYYPQYTYTAETIRKMEDELDSTITLILDGIPDSSEMDKELYIHDYITANITYNQSSMDHSNLYGALVEGKANCRGYSAAFTYLCRACGIDSGEVIGYVKRDNIYEGHAWNFVCLDSTYYYVDVCWDDFDEAVDYDGLQSLYIYYNASLKKISESHNLTETVTYVGIPPLETGDNLLYYVLSGEYATSLDEAYEVVKNGLYDIYNGSKDYILIQCDNEDVYNKVLSNIPIYIKTEVDANQYALSEYTQLTLDVAYTVVIKIIENTNEEIGSI